MFNDDLKYINQGTVYTVAKIKQKVYLNDLVVGNYYFASESEQLELCKLLAVEWAMDSTKVVLLFSKSDGKRFNLSSYTANIDNIKVFNEIFVLNDEMSGAIYFNKYNDKEHFVLQLQRNGNINCFRKIIKSRRNKKK